MNVSRFVFSNLSVVSGREISSSTMPKQLTLAACLLSLGIFLGTCVRGAAAFSDAEWVALGSPVPGVNGPVYALAISGNDVYAAGIFRSAGGTPANLIAKWNGATWSALGSGMDRAIYALAVIGTNLYAGGNFSMAGDNNANYIARWDGKSWQPLAFGLDETVYALAVSGNDLYVGGGFEKANGITVNHVAKWNGSTWSALGAGTDSTVYALAASGTDLYAGGSFSNAGAVNARSIAKWDGSTWSALGSGMPDSFVTALAILGSDLFAGGDFVTAGGTSAKCIARWNGNVWSPVGSVINSPLFALATSGNDLYAPFFPISGGGLHIGRWNGTEWSSLQLGRSGTVMALAASGSRLYVGGNFALAGEKPVNSVALVNFGGASPPTLSASHSGPSVVISWPSANSAGYVLEAATIVANSGNWTPSVASVRDDAVTKSVTLSATGRQQFFRLRRP